MISKIKVIIVFLFVFAMLKAEYHLESRISKPVGANYIQFTTDSAIDNKFLDYIKENDIEIYRTVQGLPYYYSSEPNKNIIYPFDDYSIEDKLLSADNSGDYAIRFNGTTGYQQMADFLKANYDLKTVDHNLQVPEPTPLFSKNDALPFLARKFILPVIVISLIAITLCLYVETSKSAKEILIKKINGYSGSRIISRLIIKDAISYVVISVVTLGLYTIYSGYLSFTELLFTLILIIILMLISITARITFIKLTKLTVNGGERQSKTTNLVISSISAVFTIGIITLFVFPVSIGMHSNIYQLIKLAKLVENKSEYEGYYFVEESINVMEGADDTTFANAMDNGGFTFQVIFPEYNIVQASEEYINTFFPELDGYSLIAPQSKAEELNLSCESSLDPSCENIYYYEGEQKILSFDIYMPGYISNPIISVGGGVSTSFILPISSSDIIAQIEEDYESDYTVGRQYYDIDSFITKEVKGITPFVVKNVVIFISFICSILLINQLYIEYYLQLNKTEILVKVVNGLSAPKIHSQLIYLYACMLVITLIITSAISKLLGLGVYPSLIGLLAYGLIGVVSVKYMSRYIKNYYGGR